MIGDHPMARLLVSLGPRLRQLLAGLDQRTEHVRIVIVMHALKHRRYALQAHAVSMLFLGSSETISPAACSNCMKTRFQISTKRSPSSSGLPGGPPGM